MAAARLLTKLLNLEAKNRNEKSGQAIAPNLFLKGLFYLND